MAIPIPPIDVDHCLNMNHAVKSSSVTALLPCKRGYVERQPDFSDHVNTVVRLVFVNNSISISLFCLYRQPVHKYRFYGSPRMSS